jgi:hypothetical protein
MKMTILRYRAYCGPASLSAPTGGRSFSKIGSSTAFRATSRRSPTPGPGPYDRAGVTLSWIRPLAVTAMPPVPAGHSASAPGIGWRCSTTQSPVGSAAPRGGPAARLGAPVVPVSPIASRDAIALLARWLIPPADGHACIRPMRKGWQPFAPPRSRRERRPPRRPRLPVPPPAWPDRPAERSGCSRVKPGAGDLFQGGQSRPAFACPQMLENTPLEHSRSCRCGHFLKFLDKRR